MLLKEDTKASRHAPAEASSKSHAPSSKVMHRYLSNAPMTEILDKHELLVSTPIIDSIILFNLEFLGPSSIDSRVIMQPSSYPYFSFRDMHLKRSSRQHAFEVVNPSELCLHVADLRRLMETSSPH